MNQLNVNELGGSQNFFLHTSKDGGATWQAPFTRFRDCGNRTAGKRWSSTGEHLPGRPGGRSSKDLLLRELHPIALSPGKARGHPIACTPRPHQHPGAAGIEPTSWYTLAAHPSNPKLLYAGAADIRGIASEDGGASWRIMDAGGKASANSMYAFAFDPAAVDRVYVATGKWHDWPMGWYANPLPGR